MNPSISTDAQPRLLHPTAEQLAVLRELFGFEGTACLLVFPPPPPPPESAVLREMRGMMQTMESMAGDLKAVARRQDELRLENEELKALKARLAAMHGEGLFAFAQHIDQEAREQFMAIMASGDVAKAARELGLPDPTLRSKLAHWPKRGKAYAALAEMVRWRKAIKGEAGREHAKRIASGAERDVDFPALIRDVVEELECLAPENWEERTESLAAALRRAVG